MKYSNEVVELSETLQNPPKISVFDFIKRDENNFDKNDIVKLALENKIPLELVHSCYAGGEKHCGICESCTRLKNALKNNHDNYYIGKLF